MFETLSERLSGIFRSLGKEWRLTEKNIDNSLHEVRLALLEADVHLTVVKKFVEQIKSQLLGQVIEKNLTPTQHVVKVVHTELTNILGGVTGSSTYQKGTLNTIMMVGLQGSGKTTSTAKLAFLLKNQGFTPYLVPVDVYRPAAIEQLKTLAQQLSINCFPSSTEMKPVDIVALAAAEAKAQQCDILLLDTAGRLHVDELLMHELEEIVSTIHPQEIFFVADAMVGQDILTVVESFHKVIPLTGAIMTKMDGDSRGGAALAIHSVTGVPIRYIGIGEKVSDLEVFYPDRAANRILGMGDMLTLIEKAKTAYDEAELEKLSKKIQKASFDFEDFRQQMHRMKQLGSIQSIMKLIPGFGSVVNKLNGVSIPEQEITCTEAIVNSMTMKERKHPDILNTSRKQRIAKGSGVTISQVNQMVKQFENMRHMMQKMMSGNKSSNMLNMQLFSGAGSMPNIGGGAMGGYTGMPDFFNRPGFKSISSKNSATKKKKKEHKKNKRKK